MADTQIHPWTEIGPRPWRNLNRRARKPVSRTNSQDQRGPGRTIGPKKSAPGVSTGLANRLHTGKGEPPPTIPINGI